MRIAQPAYNTQFQLETCHFEMQVFDPEVTAFLAIFPQIHISNPEVTTFKKLSNLTKVVTSGSQMAFCIAAVALLMRDLLSLATGS